MHRLLAVQATDIWDELAALKKVVCEPKGTGDAFDAVMKDFYTAVKKGRGALFIAVYRGKVHWVLVGILLLLLAALQSSLQAKALITNSWLSVEQPRLQLLLFAVLICQLMLINPLHGPVSSAYSRRTVGIYYRLQDIEHQVCRCQKA